MPVVAAEYRDALPYTPLHPGDRLREYFKANGFTPLEFGMLVGLAPRHIYSLLKHRGSVTPKTALIFGAITGTKADDWLAMQVAWDAYVLAENNELHSENVVVQPTQAPSLR